jgi:hypothetical protein
MIAPGVEDPNAPAAPPICKRCLVCYYCRREAENQTVQSVHQCLSCVDPALSPEPLTPRDMRLASSGMCIWGMQSKEHSPNNSPNIFNSSCVFGAHSQHTFWIEYQALLRL